MIINNITPIIVTIICTSSIMHHITRLVKLSIRLCPLMHSWKHLYFLIELSSSSLCIISKIRGYCLRLMLVMWCWRILILKSIICSYISLWLVKTTNCVFLYKRLFTSDMSSSSSLRLWWLGMLGKIRNLWPSSSSKLWIYMSLNTTWTCTRIKIFLTFIYKVLRNLISRSWSWLLFETWVWR